MGKSREHGHLLLSGAIAVVVLAFITNLILGQFHVGFEKQPVSHTMGLWNFGGMILAGLVFALAGVVEDDSSSLPVKVMGMQRFLSLG